MKRRNLLAGFVVALGCSQMIGYLTGAKTVSACGAGTCFAPMAEVFSAVETGAPGETGERFEPFAAEFSVRGTDGAGETGEVFERRVTPESLARIEGPHARRANYLNAFVAVARVGADADAEVNVDRDAVESAWCAGFAPAGSLRVALELPAGAHSLVMNVVAGGKTWTRALDCTR